MEGSRCWAKVLPGDTTFPAIYRFLFYTATKNHSMKKSFMVEFELPETPGDEFMERIPDQRIFVDKLMTQGVIRSYALSIDRSVLWVIMEAASEFEVMEIIAAMPLSDFMQPYISELLFYNSTEVYHQFSLN
jgi:hypothetical protein